MDRPLTNATTAKTCDGITCNYGGAGPIGLAVMALSRQAGAAHVVVSEYAPCRRDTPALFGAPGLVQQCVALSKPRGRMVVVGVCPTEDRVLPQRAMAKEIGLQFVMGFGTPDWRRVRELLDAGRADPAPVVTDTVTLDKLPAAFEALRRPTTQIKLLVRPGA